MKRLLTLSALVLFSSALAHASNGRIYSVEKMLDQWNGTPQDQTFVYGYVSGVIEADDKICTGSVGLNTATKAGIAIVQSAIESSNEQVAQQLNSTGAAAAVGFALEQQYPCK